MAAHKRRIGRGLAAAVAGALLLSGCGAQIPVDPEGTLDHVRINGLRVGLSPNEPYVNAQDSPYTGHEVELIEGFAAELGADISWVVDGEEDLVKELEAGNLDLVAGGITSETPWLDQVGVTRPYRSSTDPAGKETKLVLLVPAGENAFLGELEHYLDETQEMP